MHQLVIGKEVNRVKAYSIFLKIFTTLLIFIAGTGININSAYHYEPDVPKALRQ